MKTRIQSLGQTVKQLEKKINRVQDLPCYPQLNAMTSFENRRGYFSGVSDQNSTTPDQGQAFNNPKLLTNPRFQQAGISQNRRIVAILVDLINVTFRFFLLFCIIMQKGSRFI